MTNKNLSRLLWAITMLSFILTVWSMNIFERTFMPLGLALGIWVFTGLTVHLLSLKFISRRFPDTNLIAQLVYNMVTWGGLVLFLLLWSNRQFADKATDQAPGNIISTGHMTDRNGSHNRPYAIIHYKEIEKKVIFDSGAHVDTNSKIELTIARGYWGFELLIHADLK